MKKNAAGFTLLELVVVILILGILAAVAVPKYIDTVASARTSALNGLAAGLNGAKNLAQSEYRIEGNGYQSTVGTITVNSQSVAVLPGYGIPTTAGIIGMLEGSYANSFSTTSGPDAQTLQFTVKDFSGNPLSNCYVTYDASSTDNPVNMPGALNTKGC